jgi:hypothetical protein
VLGRLIQNGLEPTLNIAVEGIIAPALIMRLVRLALHKALVTRKRCVTAAPITATVSHIQVLNELPPRAGKTAPRGLRVFAQQIEGQRAVKAHKPRLSSISATRPISLVRSPAMSLIKARPQAASARCGSFHPGRTKWQV